MIFISQGHEKGIGLEILFKSVGCLSFNTQENLILCSNFQTVEENLSLLNINFSSTSYQLKINTSYSLVSKIYHFFGNSLIVLKPLAKYETYSQSLSSILTVLDLIQAKDIFVTLPTSKNQFYFNDTFFNGHTDFFRYFFSTQEIIMGFMSEQLNIALLTDHISLSNLLPQFNAHAVFNRSKTCISSFKDLNKNINKIFIAGFNPHCGENGLIGNEDVILENVIKDLRGEFSQLEIIGPLSADSVVNSIDCLSKSLIIFHYHDQGLGIFKYASKFNGLNISFGLPFTRISVDHGTAFDLFGKNKSNYQGCLYSLVKAFNWHKSLSK